MNIDIVITGNIVDLTM